MTTLLPLYAYVTLLLHTRTNMNAATETGVFLTVSL